VSASTEYISQQAAVRYRTQARKVWIIGLTIVALWTLAIIAAPVAKANDLLTIANPLFSFFSYICHQIPDRSFHVLGEQFGVCSRCFGVYFGILAGFAAYPIWRSIDTTEPLPRFWLFLSIIPISIDWSLTIFGIWENTQWSRFITGLILGFACAIFIVPAAVEIARNLTYRRTRTFVD
jgi:uncharacterized membrane protein